MLKELLDIGKFILGFSPWILFLFLPTSGYESLKKAVVICLTVSVVFGFRELKKGFVLQWATSFFFFFCAISFYAFNWIWLAVNMGIIANTFFAGIIWFTILIGHPFTLQYARADLPKERWNDEGLIRGSRFIAIFWGVLLLVPVAFSFFRHFYPSVLPNVFYFYLSLFCIGTGSIFTTSYRNIKRKEREKNKGLS